MDSGPRRRFVSASRRRPVERIANAADARTAASDESSQRPLWRPAKLTQPDAPTVRALSERAVLATHPRPSGSDFAVLEALICVEPAAVRTAAPAGVGSLLGVRAESVQVVSGGESAGSYPQVSK